MKRFLLALGVTAGLLLPFNQSVNADTYSCTGFVMNNEDGEWHTSNTLDLKFTVIWSIKDPDSCLDSAPSNQRGIKWISSGKDAGEFPITWKIIREGLNAVIGATFEVPVGWLESQPNLDNRFPYGFRSGFPLGFSGSAYRRATAGNFATVYLSAEMSFTTLWVTWLAKKQGIYNDSCKMDIGSTSGARTKLEPNINFAISNPGLKPIITLNMPDQISCINLIYTPDIIELPSQIGDFSGDAPTEFYGTRYLSQYPLWNSKAQKYFSKLWKNPDTLIQYGLGNFAEKPRESPSITDDLPTTWFETKRSISKIIFVPPKISSVDTVARNGSGIQIKSQLDLSQIPSSAAITPQAVVGVYIGFYYPYTTKNLCFSGGWNVTVSGNTYTARYLAGGCVAGGVTYEYGTTYLTVPLLDLLHGQGTVNRAAADKAAADKAAADKAAADKVAADKAAADKVAAAAAKKQTTITCIKGKLTKKITAVKPKCPSGYKKK